MILVELGPGHGTLMSDIARILKRANIHVDSIHLVEVSKKLREIQKKTLVHIQNVYFHDHIQDVSQGPAIIIANEFFDAFPVKQFYAGQEIKITFEGGKFKKIPCADGSQIQEEMAQAIVYFRQVLDFLKVGGGVFIIIDYGSYEGQGDTLQALYRHQYANPFENPGQADLTTHIRFREFETIAKDQGFKTHFQTQKEFLTSLGAHKYAEKLHLKADLHRLIGDMGELFKVLIINT
jgi:SAM-dependent MidA family methyltransferase